MRRARATAACVAAIAAMLIGSAATAGGTDLSWHSVDCGGGTSQGGAFEMTGTAGQADAGTMSGGAFELSGGFWIGEATVAPPCPGDVDGSGEVAFPDLLAVLASWGACPGCPADLDGDGEVAFPDLLAVLASWGPCSG